MCCRKCKSSDVFSQFQEDVDEFMALPENDGNADKVLKRFDEENSKYRFMEYNLATKKKRLKGQIPELQKSIDMMGILQSLKKKGTTMKTQFLLSDPIYMKALVPPTDKVFLCIGANVILEYDLAEAAELLRKNLAIAKKSLEVVEDDLDFLREQFTTTEVNMARVFNWNVKKRQSAAQ